MSYRESEHNTLVVAWFISELPGKSVFAKQAPQVWQSLQRLHWLHDARVNLNHVCCFEMVQRVGFNLKFCNPYCSNNNIKLLCDCVVQ